jgi:hypothetical protein
VMGEDLRIKFRCPEFFHGAILKNPPSIGAGG